MKRRAIVKQQMLNPDCGINHVPGAWDTFSGALPAMTNRLRVRVNGTMSCEFEDFRICSHTVHATHSMACTYGKANQLESVTAGGMTSFFTYDPWGRLATRTATVGGQQYTATYTWRFGDKLQRIDSSFPGEPPVVLYNYDGLGKRRIKAVGDETPYWRWDAGYNVVAEYKDQTPDCDAGALQRFFVPFGHTPLAEATPGAGDNVTNGAYTYLAHDHLGTVRQWRFANKNSARAIEYDPYGNNYAQSGFVNMPRIYALHEFDSALKQYRAPFRHYRPAMARWTTPDPLGMVDGPNRYAYVGGNPVDNSDFLGLHITDIIPNAFGGYKPYPSTKSYIPNWKYHGFESQDDCYAFIFQENRHIKRAFDVPIFILGEIKRFHNTIVPPLSKAWVIGNILKDFFAEVFCSYLRLETDSPYSKPRPSINPPPQPVRSSEGC